MSSPKRKSPAAANSEGFDETCTNTLQQNDTPSSVRPTQAMLELWGYRTVPLLPNSKRPAVTDWTNPVAIEHPAYDVPGAGIGVKLGAAGGNGIDAIAGGFLCCIDVDTEDPDIITRLEAEFPPDLAPSRRGAKGCGIFVRTAFDRKQVFKLADGGKVELLTAGQQSVIPPTVHPETGLPYVWLGAATLENTGFLELPFIEDFPALMQRVCGGKLASSRDVAPKTAKASGYPLAPPETVAALLAVIPAAERATEWLPVLAALYRTYRWTEHEAAIMAVADEWASKDADWKPGETAAKWNDRDLGKEPEKPATFGTIVELHRKHGGTVEWPPKASDAEITMRSAADIEPRRVDWLWLNRVPLGKLTILGGHPGTGKTQIALDMAARVSRGAEFPDHWPAPKGNVIVLSAEDDASDTIVPRLIAANADLSRVQIIDAVKAEKGGERQFSLVQDVAALDAAITAIGGCTLIVVDVIDSYMGNADSHKNAAVRGVLGPLAKLAEKHRCAIIGLTHFSKQAGDAAVLKFTGSIGFVGQARAAWIVTPERKEDGEPTGRNLFLAAKNNLARAVYGYAYSIEGCTVKDGSIPTSRVQWHEGVAITANEAVERIVQHKDGPITHAVEFLRQMLCNGPVSSQQIKDEAAQAGISWATVRRAQTKLKIMARKSSLRGGWAWVLPEHAHHNI